MAENNRTYLTKEKFDELFRELEELKTVRRKEVAENLEYAKSLGDLSENAEYHEARITQASLEDRIGKLEKLLKDASIVSHEAGESVSIGSVVKLSRAGAPVQKFVLVGSEEADISLGKLSIRSPLGEKLVGKKRGNFVTIKTPRGEIRYEIASVE